MKTLIKIPRIIWISIAIYIALFGFIVTWKYFNYGYNALDLAIINQVAYNTAHGDFFASSIHPPTYLGDHFTPILFLIMPFYILFQSPLTLLFLQTMLLALCAWPIFLISRHVLSKNLAVMLSIGWLLNPFVQNINLFEFHFLPIATFLILWAIYFYQQEKFSLLIITSFLAMLVREDVALVIFMFGILALIDKKSLKYKITPILISVFYFLLAMFVTRIFAPGGEYKFLIYYSWLGNGLLEILTNIFSKPGLVIQHLFGMGNLEAILGILLPFAFLPILALRYTVLASLILAQLMMGASGASGSLLQLHYSSLVLPAMVIATIYGLKKMLTLLDKHQPLVVIILILSFVYSASTLGPLPGTAVIITKSNPEKRTEINSLISKIPDDASIATSYNTLANLSSRKNITSLNYVFLGKQQFLNRNYSLPKNTEYILVNFNDLLAYKLQYGSNEFYKNQYEESIKKWPEIFENYGLVELTENFALYQKDADNNFELPENYYKKYFESIKEFSGGIEIDDIRSTQNTIDTPGAIE